MNKNNSFPLATEKDFLEMFENNEETRRYYMSLREAVLEKRIKDEVCYCDPRDLRVNEKILLSNWKPKVLLKLFDGENSSDHIDLGFSSKQLALDGDSHQNNDDDDSADDGHGVCDVQMDQDDESFKCLTQGCYQRFTSLASYEFHYRAFHNHVCNTCKERFISNFLLDIHLQETHDSYFQILCARMDMFRCLVESCDLKFKTPDLRKEHLVSVHKLPANFMLHKPKSGQTVRLKPHTSKSAAKTASLLQSTENGSKALDNTTSSSLLQPSPSLIMEFDSDSSAMSGSSSASEKPRGNKTHTQERVTMVPRAVCFGRGSRRSFQHRKYGDRGRHWHQAGAADKDTAVDLEKVDFSDMMDSLNCS